MFALCGGEIKRKFLIVDTLLISTVPSPLFAQFFINTQISILFIVQIHFPFRLVLLIFQFAVSALPVPGTAERMRGTVL